MGTQARNELPIYLFHQGTNFRAHDFFGCHFDQVTEQAAFRVWAPNALEVSVVGDWNDWAQQAHPMTRISDAGVWEVSIEGVQMWQRYKFSILGPDHVRRLKADPFAFHAETEGSTASIVCDIADYEWGDGDWMRNRRGKSPYDAPINVYELHVGSWQRHPDGRPLSYMELAEKLVPYIVKMGYTHIQLMPVMEHPLGGSLGYHITGYFAPTSRYGAPHELMTLIDRCHQAGIGVILDWVPAHFPKDEHGLVDFDGASVFGARDPLHMEQREWGTRRFDFGRSEVQAFLISSAVHWLETYHADGLRIDDLSSMIYLDYGKNHGDWIPNTYGGNENLDAIAFIRKLTRAISDICPGALMIAEEATSWPQVTIPAHEGGLGFHFKWNAGWRSDIMYYMSVEPAYRHMVHDKVTFSFYYAFNEKHILSIPHDEVIYGRRSLMEKMQGEYVWKFAGVRAFIGYMMAHPGKKHNFMGYEIGQFNEWDFESSIEWDLLDYPAHAQLQDYVLAINRFYLDTPALWEGDANWEGFEWICADDDSQNIVIFLRKDKKGDSLVVVQNFSATHRENYRFGVAEEGVYEEAFSSDKPAFGGWGHTNEPRTAAHVPMHGFPFSIEVTVPPLSTVFFKRVR